MCSPELNTCVIIILILFIAILCWQKKQENMVSSYPFMEEKRNNKYEEMVKSIKSGVRPGNSPGRSRL